MPKKDHYDLIVVGAGPGGSACAVTGVRNGLDVLMIERAEIPGQKNMSGSTLFNKICEELFPGFTGMEFPQGTPTLGNVAVKWAVDNDEREFGVAICPGADVLSQQKCVDRSMADAWMAEQAVKAGVEPLYSTRVDDVVWGNDPDGTPRVIGVVTDTGEKILGSAVADCSGLHSKLAQKTGLIPRHDIGLPQVAVKLIYQFDDPEELWNRTGSWSTEDGRPACDWTITPVFFGEEPDFFAAHMQPVFGDENIVELTVYSTYDEMIKADVNIWQRITWYQEVGYPILRGAKIIRANFHSLAAFNTVGYEGIPGYLPGFVLVGDAGAYMNPVESWGANVAQDQGRLFANLVTKMKKDNDWSLARFKEYEDTWQRGWIGQDNIPTMATLFRNGNIMKGERSTFGQLCFSVVEFARSAMAAKFENRAYADFLPKAMAKLGPVGLKLMDGGITAPFYNGAKGALVKVNALAGMLGKLKD